MRSSTQKMLLSAITALSITIFWFSYFYIYGGIPTFRKIQITQEIYFSLPFDVSRLWDVCIGLLWSPFAVFTYDFIQLKYGYIPNSLEMEERDGFVVLPTYKILLISAIFLAAFSANPDQNGHATALIPAFIFGGIIGLRWSLDQIIDMSMMMLFGLVLGLIIALFFGLILGLIYFTTTLSGSAAGFVCGKIYKKIKGA